MLRILFSCLVSVFVCSVLAHIREFSSFSSVVRKFEFPLFCTILLIESVIFYDGYCDRVVDGGAL